jgi:1-deoxy-D-xylulose-5-phosphate reductoisomerase
MRWRIFASDSAPNWRPVVPDGDAGCDAGVAVAAGRLSPPRWVYGAAALEAAASAPQVDQVMAAIVGAAGLVPTWPRCVHGKRVLLAKRDSSVMAGRLFVDACASAGATVLPIDSEHDAVSSASRRPRPPRPPGSLGPRLVFGESC